MTRRARRIAAGLIGVAVLGAAPARQGSVLDRLPEKPDANARYLIYLHGRIIEDQGRRPTHPTRGVYEYDAILSRLAADGVVVVSEQRPPKTDMDGFARHVVDQIGRLLKGGAPPERVSVVGFSKGGGIAKRASALLKNPRVNFVFLAACGDDESGKTEPPVWGRILSIYEASDELGRSCQGLFDRSGATGERSEIRIDLGEGHGAFFRPHDEWITPVLRWVAR